MKLLLKKTTKLNMINGVVTDFVHIDDRSIHYGDGVFETILCSGNKLYFWKQHYQRLSDSALKLNIKCPDEGLLLDDIRRLLSNENVSNENISNKNIKIEKNSVLKIILSRGTSERGYGYSDKIMSNRFVSLASLDTDYSSLLSEKLLDGGLYFCKTQVSINESLAGIKHLNRLENVLARNEWGKIPRNNNTHNSNEREFIDGLMLNANQQVIECTMSNIFAVKNNQLFTPDLSQSGVRGIMRDHVMNIAAEANIQVSACTISVAKLMAMDELFITNSLIGIKLVRSFNEKTFNQSSVTQSVFKTLLTTKEENAQKI